MKPHAKLCLPRPVITSDQLLESTRGCRSYSWDTSKNRLSLHNVDSVEYSTVLYRMYQAMIRYVYPWNILTCQDSCDRFCSRNNALDIYPSAANVVWDAVGLWEILKIRFVSACYAQMHSLDHLHLVAIGGAYGLTTNAVQSCFVHKQSLQYLWTCLCSRVRHHLHRHWASRTKRTAKKGWKCGELQTWPHSGESWFLAWLFFNR